MLTGQVREPHLPQSARTKLGPNLPLLTVTARGAASAEAAKPAQVQRRALWRAIFPLDDFPGDNLILDAAGKRVLDSALLFPISMKYGIIAHRSTRNSQPSTADGGVSAACAPLPR